MSTGLRMLSRRWIARLELQALGRLPRAAFEDALPAAAPGALLVSVYRARNAMRVGALARQAEALGARVALWGLDGVAQPLASRTVGAGPGARSRLLSALVERGAPGPDDHVVVADDDVEFASGDLGALLRVAAAGGFMMAQPAHLRDSFFSYAFTCGRPHLTARATRFVECGPMLVVSPAFRDRVFPMPGDLGMGWGSEVLWSAQLRPGERFGIIDAVRIRHLGEVGKEYGHGPEKDRLAAILARAGLRDTKEICRTSGRWLRWRMAPDWAAGGPGSTPADTGPGANGFEGAFR